MFIQTLHNMFNLKSFSFCIFIAVILSSCKKDDKNISPKPPPPIVESNSDYFLSDSSNYWIYETVQIDTNNNQHFIKKDTVTVRTENVNGTEYIVFNKSAHFGSNRTRYDDFVRDSAGYMIRRYSKDIIFSASDLNTVLRVDSSMPNIFITKYRMIKDSTQLILPVGTFNNVLTFQGEVRAVNGATIFYPEIRYTKQSYVKGVGLSFESFFYFNSPGHIERRLIDYQVK